MGQCSEIDLYTCAWKAETAHSRELQWWGPSSLEHSVYKHPVFSQTPEVEFPRACAIFAGGEYFEVPPGDEARVSHADIHGALR